MRLSELGEFSLIQKIHELFKTEMPSGVIGIGDDCAVIPREMVDREMLVTSDLLVEGTHFLRETTSAKDLGYKTLAVNLSDVAAMGGKPQFAFLSLALPPSLDLEWVEDFLMGFRRAAMESSVALLGGDTTRSDRIFINVTLMGSGQRRQIKRRTYAQSGDIVAVTGVLGDSAGGLEILKAQQSGHPLQLDTHIEQLLIQKHLRPKPQTAEGIWLGRQPEVRAMMDVSDGLATDLQRLVEQSGCGFDIHLERLPLSKELKIAGSKMRWAVDEMAACGGEDYVLVVTVEADRFERLQEQFMVEFERPLYQIGQVVSEQTIRFFRGQRPVQLELSGFDHFISEVTQV